MSKEDVIIKEIKIKYKGIFDLSLLYKKLREWLMDTGFSDPIEDGEKKYGERIKPNGKQIEIVWETSKKAEDYFKLKIDIRFFINGLTEAEVEREGKKIKLDNCELEMVFVSTLIRDADNKWEHDHPFMFKLYEKYIIKHKIEEFKIELYKATNRYVDEVKNFLNLYRF